jgi:hypothetical protein
MSDINVKIVSSENINISQSSGAVTAKMQVGNDIANKILPVIFQGTLIAGKTLNGMHFQGTCTIAKIGLLIEDAPSGAAVTIDILKNSVEQSRIGTLADGATGQETTITALGFTNSDEFGVRIKSVGSIEPGAGLTVLIFYI